MPCAYTQNTLCVYAKFPRLYAKTNGEKDGLSDFRVDVRLSEAGLLQFGTVALRPLVEQLAC